MMVAHKAYHIRMPGVPGHCLSGLSVIFVNRTQLHLVKKLFANIDISYVNLEGFQKRVFFSFLYPGEISALVSGWRRSEDKPF